VFKRKKRRKSRQSPGGIFEQNGHFMPKVEERFCGKFQVRPRGEKEGGVKHKDEKDGKGRRKRNQIEQTWAGINLEGKMHSFFISPGK